MHRSSSESRERLSRVLRQAIAGDRLALQQLVTAYHGRLRVYVRRKFPLILAPMYEPDDFVQQAMAKASFGIREFNPDGDDAFYRWIVTIARNEMGQAIRRQRAQKRGADNNRASLGVLAGATPIEGILEQLAIFERTPSQSAMGHEAATMVSKAIAALDAPMREALRYQYFDHLPAAEIAQRMGRTDRAVHGLIYRALKKLREQLDSRSHYM